MENLDYMRGLAILLVVIGHFLEMTILPGRVGETLDFIAYTIHVPTFLLCSGYLFSNTIRKYHYRYIIKTKLLDDLLIWLIWSVVLLAVNYGCDFLFDALDKSVFEYIFYSFNQLWYFGFLFFCYIVTITIENLKISKKIVWGVLIFLFFFLCFYSVSLCKIILHYAIFFLGYSAKDNLSKISRYGIVVYTILMGCTIFVLGINTTNLFDSIARTIGVFVLKIFGAVFAFSVGDIVKGRGIISSLGRDTIYIYIFHFFILALYHVLDSREYAWSMLVFIMSGIAFSLLIKKVLVANRMLFIVKPSLLLKKNKT